ncbi:hypothetical protein MASR1M66_11660 [Aminivibrio sp.]
MAKAYGQMEGEEVSKTLLGAFYMIGEKMVADDRALFRSLRRL